MVALHASDPIAPYLSAWARVASLEVADLETALYDERSLWRMHAMRRTLFVVPTDEAAAFLAGATRQAADRERRRVLRWLEASLRNADPAEYFASARGAALDVLADGAEWTTESLVSEVAALQVPIQTGSGKWSVEVSLGSRLLIVLAMEGEIVRARPAGSWRSSQYGWAAARPWFGHVPDSIDARGARQQITRRYLEVFGPVTLQDLRWWSGWTSKHSEQALQDAEAEAVVLEDGRSAFVSAGDADADTPATESVALLPGLDPTPMGWKDRGWFMGRHATALTDGRGNVGPTVWLDGRIVGGWGQQPDGIVAVRLLEEVDRAARARIDVESASLATWLDGAVVVPRYRTPLERELADTSRA